jgi:hypothetical protein
VTVAAVRLGEWLDEHLATVDPDLAARVRAAIAPDALDGDVSGAPQSLLDAAVRALTPLADEGCTRRASALDLLAVDALVTLACESLADAPAGMTTGELATRAGSMIRALAATLPPVDGAA